jgi:hypothetical protein
LDEISYSFNLANWYSSIYNIIHQRIQRKTIDIVKKVWTVWKFTIGSFSDERTKEHDNMVAILRTIIVVVNVLTCLMIVANIIHNW